MGKVEFALDGTILDANPRFLETVGYQLEELKGQHHRLLVDPDYAQSADYRAFWDTLRRGEYLAGEFCRVARTGTRSGSKAQPGAGPGPQALQDRQVRHRHHRPGRAEPPPQAGDGGGRGSRPGARGAAQVAAGDVHPGHPIWDGILLLPLVGIIDSMRTADVMNKSLTKIAETRARVFVLTSPASPRWTPVSPTS